MAQHPSDMRAGVNKLCGQVRSVGLEPTNGDVYVFVGSRRKLMKLLHWERGGYVVYYKRLEQGRFHPRIFLRQGIGCLPFCGIKIRQNRCHAEYAELVEIFGIRGLCIKWTLGGSVVLALLQ